jgi:hypothetical protein
LRAFGLAKHVVDLAAVEQKKKEREERKVA